MSKKTNLILFLVFVVLLGLVLLENYNSRSGRQNSSVADVFHFSDFKQDTTDSISIRSGSGAILVVRENNRWTVNNFPADAKVVSHFFETLSEAKPVEIVARSKDSQSGLGVSDANGQVLTLKAGGTETSFVIGQENPMGTSFYARLPGSDTTYRLASDLARQVQNRVTDWRNKTIANLAPETISQIEIIRDKNVLTLTRKDTTKWQVGTTKGMKDLADEKATSLLSSLQPLEASDFLTSAERTTFEAAKGKVGLKVYDQKGEILLQMNFLEKAEIKKWWGQVVGQEELYSFDPWQLSNLLLAEKDLL